MNFFVHFINCQGDMFMPYPMTHLYIAENLMKNTLKSIKDKSQYF